MIHPSPFAADPNPVHAACIGKEAYATPQMAQKVVERMNRRGNEHREKYRCTYCLRWHIGSRP